MYSTTSMGECAYLLLKGFCIQGIADNRASKVKTYLFEREAAQAVQGYYTDDAVPARAFHLALQTARRLVRSDA
jgi:hypothetical protein